MVEPKTIRLCFRYTYGKPLKNHFFNATLNNRSIKITLDKEGRSEPMPLGTLVLDQCEMIDLKTRYPTHKQILHLSEFSASQEVLITVLPPSMIVNLKDSLPLTSEQMEYFKINGNNALLFIHGFNTPLGEYGFYPESYALKATNGISEFHLKGQQEQNQNLRTQETIEFKKSPYVRTICLDPSKNDEICAHFPDLPIYWKHYFSKYHKETNRFFNGTEARQWFTHMEYNFNYAAGFDGKNFTPYTRILGVHWPGDEVVNFKKAEQNADKSAIPLAKIIQQLAAAHIKINLVAHSLGCRVALKALHLLAEYDKAKKDLLEQVVLWQAALPNTALGARNPEFRKAYHRVKKIMVLYSTKDRVLQTLYQSAQFGKLTLKQALGLTGPKPDPQVGALQRAQKLNSVDQSNHLFSHSALKIPSKKLMNDVYQEYVIGGPLGIKAFGCYNCVSAPSHLNPKKSVYIDN